MALEGYCNKLKSKVPAFGVAWNKRWFVVEKRPRGPGKEFALAYYESERAAADKTKAKSWVFLRDIEAVHEIWRNRRIGLERPEDVSDRAMGVITKDKELIFEVDTPGRYFLLQAPNKEKLQYWVAGLQSMCAMRTRSMEWDERAWGPVPESGLEAEREAKWSSDEEAAVRQRAKRIDSAPKGSRKWGDVADPGPGRRLSTRLDAEAAGSPMGDNIQSAIEAAIMARAHGAGEESDPDDYRGADDYDRDRDNGRHEDDALRRSESGGGRSSRQSREARRNRRAERLASSGEAKGGDGGGSSGEGSDGEGRRSARRDRRGRRPDPDPMASLSPPPTLGGDTDGGGKAVDRDGDGDGDGAGAGDAGSGARGALTAEEREAQKAAMRAKMRERMKAKKASRKSKSSRKDKDKGTDGDKASRGDRASRRAPPPDEADEGDERRRSPPPTSPGDDGGGGGGDDGGGRETGGDAGGDGGRDDDKPRKPKGARADAARALKLNRRVAKEADAAGTSAGGGKVPEVEADADFVDASWDDPQSPVPGSGVPSGAASEAKSGDAEAPTKPRSASELAGVAVDEGFEDEDFDEGMPETPTPKPQEPERPAAPADPGVTADDDFAEADWD